MRRIIRLCGPFISVSRTSPFLLAKRSSSASFEQGFSGSLTFSATPLPPKMAQLGMQIVSLLEEKIKREDARHRNANERSWELNAALIRCETAHETSEFSEDFVSKEEENLDKLVLETVLSPDMYKKNVDDIIAMIEGDSKLHQRAPRIGGLVSKLEDYARYKAFRYFLSEEKLLSPNAPCFVTTENGIPRNILTDEEYLAGACIGLCHDLAKYGVTRASNAVDDESTVPFIKRARDAVSLILEELLQFDFRNGPLRRKYDSTKYALKTLETVLYELSVAGSVGGHKSLVGKGNGADDDDGGPLKKMKIADEDKMESDEDHPMEGAAATAVFSGIPSKEISALRERMDHRDKLREKLIKTCRDGQKAAKQSIFAMHRGDAERAAKLLKDCENCVTNDLLPILKEEPTLRYGSFACVLEEYVEGKLFYTWLYGDGDDDGENNDAAKGGSNQRAVGKILLPDEIPLKISTDDYLGGLGDLTGEIGRFAVARGTARDKESVKLCLDSNKAVQLTIKMLGKLPRGMQKKVGMVNKSVEKLERVLYEQSLMEMTGRKHFASSVEERPGFDNHDDNGDD